MEKPAVKRWLGVGVGVGLGLVLAGCTNDAELRARCGADWGSIYIGMPQERLECVAGRGDLAPRPIYSETRASGRWVIWHTGGWLRDVTTRDGRVVSWRGTP